MAIGPSRFWVFLKIASMVPPPKKNLVLRGSFVVARNLSEWFAQGLPPYLVIFGYGNQCVCFCFECVSFERPWEGPSQDVLSDFR